MAADDFPREYDDIVLGTGVQESIIAAALARVGRRVLHLDRNDYYSGEWASFHLKGMLDWVQKAQETTEDSSQNGNSQNESVTLQDGERLVHVPSGRKTVSNVVATVHVKMKLDEVEPPAEPILAASPAASSGPASIPPDVVDDAGASSETQGPAQEQQDAPTSPVQKSNAACESNLLETQQESSSAETGSTSRQERGDTPHTGNSVINEQTRGLAADGNINQSSENADGNEERNSGECNFKDDQSEQSALLGQGGNECQESTNQQPSSVIQGQPMQTTAGVADQDVGQEQEPGKGQQGIDEGQPDVHSGQQNEPLGQQDEPSGQQQNNQGQPFVEQGQEGTADGQGANQSQQNTGPVTAPSQPERRREWTWEDVSKEWRRFNIDLAPKLMFCRGSMVELLVSSRISRYAEFKAVTRILTHINGKLEQVPCSRSDVFSSRYVSMLEKRMLMKLIEFCLDYENREDEYREFIDRPFSEFLKSRKLTTTLQHFVIHSIAMVTTDTPTQQALRAMQYFLRSLGRYGNTAFLWTLYGSGELPQCFCRMCAVFAGIYVLRTGITTMIADNENKIKAVIDTEGRRLSCRNLIMEYSYAPPQATPLPTSYISRGVLITDKSLKPAESEQITLLTIPPLEGSTQPVHVIEVGFAACAAPKNLYVVHLTSKASDSQTTAQEDLKPVVEKFFQTSSHDDSSNLSSGDNGDDEDKPHILWSLFFTQEDVTDIPDDVLREGLPGNVHITSGAGRSIGFDHAVAQAKRIFESLCPGEEFLPAAPEPEDLVFEDPAPDNLGHSKAGFDQEKEGEETTQEFGDKSNNEQDALTGSNTEEKNSAESKERETNNERKEEQVEES